MSYILDALRRADSERERGQIPGIHAQPVAPLPPDEPTASGVSPRVWGAAVAGALLSGALAWWFMSGERPVAAPAAPAPAPAAAAAAAAAPAPWPAPALAPASLPPAVIALPRQGAADAAGSTPSPTSTPLPAAAAAPTAAALPLPPRPIGVPPVAAAQAVEVAATLAEPRDAIAPPAALPKAARGASGARGAASPATEAEPRVQALHELPEEVRRAVPPLVVNGSVYSKNPADRFLIVNGQIVHESDTVAPNVVLEKIGPRSAVLGIHGHRFEIGY